MRIAPLAPEHLGDVRRLYKLFLAEAPYAYPTFDEAELDNFVLTVVQHLQHPASTFHGWVAIVGKKVVGFLAGDIGQRAIGRPLRYGNAMWLFVHPAHRRRGIGRQLIAPAVTWLTEEGIEAVELFARHDDPQWAARGFTPYLTRYVAPLTTVATLLSAPLPARKQA